MQSVGQVALVYLFYMVKLDHNLFPTIPCVRLIFGIFYYISSCNLCQSLFIEY